MNAHKVKQIFKFQSWSLNYKSCLSFLESLVGVLWIGSCGFVVLT